MKKQRTQAELDAIQSSWYADDCGVVRWKRDTNRGKKIGDPVGLTVFKSGHRNVLLYIDKKLVSFPESNVVWFLTNGHWPYMEVDHIDGNPQNNLSTNLRLANRKQQCQNRTSGRAGRANKGVYKRSYGNKWTSQIWINGTCKNLGTYDSEDEAAEVRQLATEMCHGTFSNTKSYDLGVSQ